MTNNQFVFLLELLIRDNNEKGLLQSLIQNPLDEATRNAYVDYLLDNDRPQSAELVRKGSFTPGVTDFLNEIIPQPVWNPINTSGGISSGLVYLRNPQ